MSKTLTKILTICGLFVVVVAAVVGSAICATAAIGCNVIVDIVKNMNTDFNSPNGNVKIKINGVETDKLLVKKGQEATVTFEATDFEFKGFYSGAEGNYTEEDLIKDQDGILVNEYKIVVNEETNLTAVFDSSVFYNVKLASKTNGYDIKDGRAISLSAEGSSVYQVENKDEYWVKKDSKITLSHSQTGYNFKNWFVGDVADNVNTSAEITVEGNNVYTADFDVIKYMIAYDGAERVETVYGTSLKQGPEASYSVENGYKVFAGWTRNDAKVDKAIFEGENTNIDLTSTYTNQSEKTYTFKSGDKSIAYKTVSGSRLDLTNAPSKNYYNLTGIKFTIGETDFEFAISENNLVPVEGGKTIQELDKALMDSGKNEFSATPVYKLAFEIKFNVYVGDEKVSSDEEGVVISKESTVDIASEKVLEYFANAAATIKNATYIQVADADGACSFGTGLDKISIADILDGLGIAAGNASDVEIDIEFII